MYVCNYSCVYQKSNYKVLTVYDNSSDKFNTEFDIRHCPIKIKVTEGILKFSPFTIILTVSSYNYALTNGQGDGFKICCSI